MDITKLQIATCAAECVEEILETIEKDAKSKPWVLIIEERITQLLKPNDSTNKRRTDKPKLR